MKGLFYRLIRCFRDSTMRKKLMLSYFVLIFVPLGILTAVSYIRVSREYENQILYSASKSFDQAHTFISYKVNTLIQASDIVYFDTTVQAVLSRGRPEYEADLIQQNIDMAALDNFLNSFKNDEDVFRVCLYVPGWLSFSDQDVNFSNMDAFSETPHYDKLILTQDKVLWLPADAIIDENSFSESVAVISLLRKIRNSERLAEIIGIVKVSILESQISDIIRKANITKNGAVYLQNSGGEIICSSNTDLVDRYELKENIRRLGEGRTVWEVMSIGAEQFTVNAREVENTDWTLITAIPYSEILSQSNKIRELMLVLTLVIGVIAYGLAYIISTSTTKRISLLMKKMSKVQEGVLDVNIPTRSRDEIGKLISCFNYMVKRINMLAEERYRLGKEIKNAELKALQAQINPHFLYNTLDLINWKAMDNDVLEIAEISRSLARFYKLSLSKGKDIVSVGEELRHVETYVEIQNYRFDNRIKFLPEVPENIRQYGILKIILQPLVENSILHGILKKKSGQEGIIKLGGRLENGMIILTVRDDGAGMTGERVREILSPEAREPESRGYGVRNIDDRIKLCYGQRYGLTYHSSPGKGTLAEVRLPALKAGDSPF